MVRQFSFLQLMVICMAVILVAAKTTIAAGAATTTESVDVTETGETIPEITEPDPIILFALNQAANSETKKDLIKEVALAITRWKNEPDAKAMYEYLKTQEKVEAKPDQYVAAMAVTMDHIKNLKLMYKELKPEEAFTQLVNEGMVPETMKDMYEANPKQLEDDTHRGFHLRFLKLAYSGGFLDSMERM